MSFLPKFYLSDIKAGFFVFLIALPLSLGISIASGCPPIAGIITAIVGGILSGFLGGSRLTIKGPAAGLIVIVLGAVQDLGQGDLVTGYRAMLAVTIVAGVFQVILSRLKAGKIGEMMPPSVIHGMMAAIGIIILAKQVHLALGVAPHGKSPLALLAEIPQSIMNANPIIVLIGVITLAALIITPKIPGLRKVPAALLALVCVVPLGIYFHFNDSHLETFLKGSYAVGPQFLVNLPADPFSALAHPLWSAVFSWTGFRYFMLFSLVGSIESLLTASAVDSLDPEKKPADLNKDLFALGVSNIVAGFLGGLPMISEIVRSRSNIDNGAKGASANFFHGVFLAAAVILLPGLLHEVPVAALAAMLIMTGFRLASPKVFHHTWKIGPDQFVIFTVTCVMTLATDLLVGVVSGVIAKVVLYLLIGVRPSNVLKLTFEEQEEGERHVRVYPSGACTFANQGRLIAQVTRHLRASTRVTVDFGRATFVDHATFERIYLLQHTYGIQSIQLMGLQHLKGTSGHELATRRA
jgi:MFS superfamily sulfate permease-like transporter